jgi:hypothetical protein
MISCSTVRARRRPPKPQLNPENETGGAAELRPFTFSLQRNLVGRGIIVCRVLNFGRRVVDGAFDCFASFMCGVAYGSACFFSGLPRFGCGLFSVGAGLIGFSLAARSQTQSRRSGDGE